MCIGLDTGCLAIRHIPNAGYSDTAIFFDWPNFYLLRGYQRPLQYLLIKFEVAFCRSPIIRPRDALALGIIAFMVAGLMVVGPAAAAQFIAAGGVIVPRQRAGNFPGTAGLPLLGQYLSQG